jgi:hypothetical protein
VIADEPAGGPPELVSDTLMDTADDRVRLARETVEFATSLRATR